LSGAVGTDSRLREGAFPPVGARILPPPGDLWAPDHQFAKACNKYYGAIWTTHIASQTVPSGQDNLSAQAEAERKIFPELDAGNDAVKACLLSSVSTRLLS